MDNRWVTVLAGLVIAASPAVVIARNAARTLDMGTKDRFEAGTVVMTGQRMVREWPSPAWLTNLPTTIAVYGPAYYLAIGGVTHLGSPDNPLLPGRLLTLGSGLALAALVGWLVGRRSHSLVLGLAAMAAVLSVPIVSAWLPYARVDIPATLFAVLAYVFASKADRGAPWLAAIAVVSASLFKQPTGLCAVPIAVALWLNGGRVRALTFVIVLAILGLAAWVAADLASGGFFRTVLFGMGEGSRATTAQFWTYGLATILTPPFVLAGGAAAVLVIRQPRDAVRCVYVLALAFGIATNLVLVMRQGAAPYYFLEASVLAVVVVFLHGFGPLYQVFPQRTLTLAALLTATVALPQVGPLLRSPQRLPTGRDMLLDLPQGARILADATPMDVLMSAGFEPIVNDPFAYGTLASTRRFSTEPLVQAMEVGTVTHLVLERPLEEHHKAVGLAREWPDAILATADRHFTLDRNGQGLWIYRRKTIGP